RIPDDAGKCRITVIGQPEDRAPVLLDLQKHPALAWCKDRATVQAYPPGHWKVVRDHFVDQGKPTIYFQASTGEVPHRQDDYQGGAEALGQVLRMADPHYKPELDNDWRIVRTFAFPKIPWDAAAVAVAAGVLLLLPRRKP